MLLLFWALLCGMMNRRRYFWYRTWRSKVPSLLYETWFYALYLVQRPFLDQTNCGIGKN